MYINVYVSNYIILCERDHNSYVAFLMELLFWVPLFSSPLLSSFHPLLLVQKNQCCQWINVVPIIHTFLCVKEILKCIAYFTIMRLYYSYFSVPYSSQITTHCGNSQFEWNNYFFITKLYSKIVMYYDLFNCITVDASGLCHFEKYCIGYSLYIYLCVVVLYF